jgi:hypothetical protein
MAGLDPRGSHTRTSLAGASTPSVAAGKSARADAASSKSPSKGNGKVSPKSQTRLLVLAGVGVVFVMLVLVLDPFGFRASEEPPPENVSAEEQALVGTGPKGSVRNQSQGPQTTTTGTPKPPDSIAAPTTDDPLPPPEPGTRRVSPNVPE